MAEHANSDDATQRAHPAQRDEKANRLEALRRLQPDHGKALDA